MRIRSIAILTAALAISACSAENTAVFSSWHQPAGAFLDDGTFGNPTMRNTMAMKCAGQPKGYIVPDYIVVLNPESPKSPQPDLYGAPRYGRVQCSGTLNGKYAKVIFDGYIESAASASTLSGDGATLPAAGG